MRRALDQTLISAGALAVLVVGLVLVDERLRDGLGRLFGRAPSTEVLQAGAAVRELGSLVIAVASEQATANASLMIFVVVATVLMLFMVRT